MDELPHVVVTAGGTVEPIDSVRSWGNRFTGKTGMTISLAISRFARVTLLLSRGSPVPTETVTNPTGRLAIRRFTTGDELAAELQGLVQDSPAAIFMTAAVGDYRPIRTVEVIAERAADAEHPDRRQWIVKDISGHKIKSDHERIAVLAVRTPKIIDQVRGEWGYRGLIYKFKLEAGISEPELIRIAEESRRISQADVMVANTLEMTDEIIGGAWILDSGGQRRVRRPELADYLAADLQRRLATAAKV